MKVLLAHPGTQHAFKLASELQRRNLLAEFWTCFAIAGKSARGQLLQLAPAFVRERFENRIVADVPGGKLRTLPRLEAKARRQLSRGGEAEKVMQERNCQFQESIADRSIEDVDAVIGFDTSSWLLVERAKRAKKRFLLDQTTAHPTTGRSAWAEAGDDFPEWREEIPAAIDQVFQNQMVEHERADLIVTASSFARNSFSTSGSPASPLSVR